MQVGIIGVNHKLASLTLRECMHRVFQKYFSGTCLPFTNFVLLLTCNRSELYFSSSDLAATHSTILGILRQELSEEFDQKLYSFFGRECFLHLARVTAGLDSAIIAETEIQGQVRRAYEQACGERLLSRDLHFLFQKSLQIGKDVRTRHLAETPRHATLEQAIYFTMADFFPASPTTLMIGASEINVKVARFLKRRGIHAIWISNRSVLRGSTVASEIGIPLLPWERIASDWAYFDCIISATKSERFVLSSREILSSFAELTKADLMKRKLLVDLAVPRNIDPALPLPHWHLYNIDALNTRLQGQKRALEHVLERAEKSLHASVQSKLHAFSERVAWAAR